MIESYQWIKALHLISVIAWMAGMLYLPRLFVYHCDAEPGSDKSETFKVMERRLLRGIMGPAMILTWALGLMLLYLSEAWTEGWMMAKGVLIVVMTVVHHYFALWRKDFEADRNERPAKFYRIANEVPTVLMIGIVILVIVQPF
jgi:putative membrane protein